MSTRPPRPRDVGLTTRSPRDADPRSSHWTSLTLTATPGDLLVLPGRTTPGSLAEAGEPWFPRTGRCSARQRTVSSYSRRRSSGVRRVRTSGSETADTAQAPSTRTASTTVHCRSADSGGQCAREAKACTMS